MYVNHGIQAIIIFLPNLGQVNAHVPLRPQLPTTGFLYDSAFTPL